METRCETTGTILTPLEYHRLSLRLVPLQGKRPLLKEWPHLHLSERAILEWDRRGVNWGAITGDPLIVLDTDTEEAEAWVRQRGVESTVMVRSGRGGTHRYFLKPESVTGIRSRNGMHRINGLDVKGWHGFIVLPGSVHPETDQRYAFLPGKELHALHVLPPFDIAWMQAAIRAEPELQRFAAIPGHGPGEIRDIDAYIHGIVSIQGQNGSNAMMAVCYRLIDAGHTFAEALAKLRIWNEACAFPAWADKELVRGLTNAFKRKAAQPMERHPNPHSSPDAHQTSEAV